MEGFEPFDADEDECKPGESESENEEDLSSLTMTFLKIYWLNWKHNLSREWLATQ